MHRIVYEHFLIRIFQRQDSFITLYISLLRHLHLVIPWDDFIICSGIYMNMKRKYSRNSI